MSTDRSVTENPDIFYKVKKEILDKLDIILQKINLEIIDSRHSFSDDFTFIELAQFQTEISTLFVYLDKLYDSLNSSVSVSNCDYSSIIVEEIKHKNEQLEHETQKLKLSLKSITEENQKLKHELDCQSQKKWQRSKVMLKLEQQLSKINDEITTVKKQIKVSLKQFKFQLLEKRVEIISKLKEHEANLIEQQVCSRLTIRGKQNLQSSKATSKSGCESCLPEGNEILIMKALDQILNLC